ncbi:SPOSA6832_00129, partial [Sporobolomyces salmonicolor]
MLHDSKEEHSAYQPEDGFAGDKAPKGLTPTKSRNGYERKTLANKPPDVDEAVWLDESSVHGVGIKERKGSKPPHSFSPNSYAGATLSIFFIGISTYYTSWILWKFCMAHPEIRDIADAAQVLTGSKIGWYVAFCGLALNNWCIMAIQTIRGGTESTVVWAVSIGIIMWFFSNLRDFSSMSTVGLLASSTMFVCVLIVLCGHGVQGHPSGWTEGLTITHSVWAPEGTTFVQGMNALLNVVYTFIGHALIPSFVGDMERPQDFPKALGLSMAAEFCLFTITGAVVYHYTGIELTTAPAYGSLRARFGKVAAGFTLPTIIIVGVLYSLVTSRAIFFQLFKEGSPHRSSHTVIGWATWIGIVFVGWIVSFIIGEAVPFFSDLLSLISSLFDSLNKGRRFSGPTQIFAAIVNLLILITGFFFFGAGTYASVQSIIDSYNAGAVKSPFTRANTGFILDH